MNVREAINFGLNKVNFENIRENQRNVVEAYLSGRDVLMISPAGSGKSLTFHIAPFAPVKKESRLLLWVQTVQKIKTRH